MVAARVSAHGCFTGGLLRGAHACKIAGCCRQATHDYNAHDIPCLNLWPVGMTARLHAQVSRMHALVFRKKWQSLHARRARHAECAPPCRGSVNDAATAAGDNGGGGTTAIGGSGGLGEPELKFDEQQLDAFSGLEAAMRGYATMSVAASGVAVGKVVLLIVTTGSLKAWHLFSWLNLLQRCDRYERLKHRWVSPRLTTSRFEQRCSASPV